MSKTSTLENLSNRDLQRTFQKVKSQISNNEEVILALYNDLYDRDDTVYTDTQKYQVSELLEKEILRRFLNEELGSEKYAGKR